jgi:membrane protein implicated in regulation of membrane protease activity
MDAGMIMLIVFFGVMGILFLWGGGAAYMTDNDLTSILFPFIGILLFIACILGAVVGRDDYYRSKIPNIEQQLKASQVQELEQQLENITKELEEIKDE